MATEVPEWKKRHLAEQERRKQEKEEQDRAAVEERQRTHQLQLEQRKKLEEQQEQWKADERRRVEEDRLKKLAEAEEKKKLFAGTMADQERQNVLSAVKATIPATKAGGPPKDPLPTPGSPHNSSSPSFSSAPPKDNLPTPPSSPQSGGSSVSNSWPPPASSSSPAPSSPQSGGSSVSNSWPPSDSLPVSPAGKSGGASAQSPGNKNVNAADNNVPAWKQRQLEEEKLRKERETKEAEEKRQKLVEIQSTLPPPSGASEAVVNMDVEDNTGTHISKPKRQGVRAATTNPITNASNLSTSSPTSRQAIPGGMSLASAGAVIAEKRKAASSIQAQDDNDGAWGQGEEKPEPVHEYQMGAQVFDGPAMGIGAFDAAAMKGNLKKTDGIAGDTHL